MKRASLPIVLALLLALPQPAWAQGSGNGGGNGNSDNSGGQGNGGDRGRGDNAAGDNGNQNGNAFGQGNGGGKASVPPPVRRELSEDDVLAAVEAGRAVELSTILPDVRSRTGGEVINAQLQQVGGFLLYAVTVLTPSGQVLTEHYYARSGVHVAK
jgi:hypothetical protein